MQAAVDLDAVKSKQRQTATAAQARPQPQSFSANSSPDSTSSAAEEMLWLTCLAKMTGHVVANLPKMWQLTKVGMATCYHLSAKNGMPHLPRSQHKHMLGCFAMARMQVLSGHDH